MFLALELPAADRVVPWPTFSGFVWASIRWWHPVALLVVLVTLVLLGHFLWHWHARWLIAVSVTGAVAVTLHATLR